MWWEPRNEAEHALRKDLYRLNDLFLTPSRAIDEVIAVGSTVVAGVRVPLIVLHESLYTERVRLSMRQRLQRARRSCRPIFDPRSWTMRPKDRRDDTVMHISHAPKRVQALLSPWEPPRLTYLMFASWPEPVFSQRKIASGLRLWCGGKTATLGIALRCGGRLFGTTAGHAIAATPCSIEHRSSGWFASERSEVVGKALYSSDPSSGPGADVALLEFAPSTSDPAPNEGVQWATARLAAVPVPDQSELSLIGGVSGLRRGWADNPLLSTRRLRGESRHWANAWTVMEKSGGFAQRGDSGGIVYNDINEVVGHVVAAFGVVCRAGRLQCGLVQDIHTVLGEVARRSDLQLEPVLKPSDLGAKQGWRATFYDWLHS
jgi:hypothetical protein